MKKNVMEMVHKKNQNIEWEKKDGLIVLKIKRRSAIDRLVYKIFKSPQVISIELEEIGSFIWQQCDGIKNINQISQDLKEHFGEKAEPVINRLVQYLKVLVNNNLIKLEYDTKGENS